MRMWVRVSDVMALLEAHAHVTDILQATWVHLMGLREDACWKVMKTELQRDGS